MGKTFLIRKTFKNYPHFFHFTGKKDGPSKDALNRFGEYLSHFFQATFKYKETITHWHKAFQILNDQIDNLQAKKFVIFIDEVPWLDAYGSNIINEIDHFWNTCCIEKGNILLILCGSAASWIIDNIIYNKGGLHNRMTSRIILRPFTLSETQDFIKSKKLLKSKKEILDLYLGIGGIPLYLAQVQKSLSVASNIDEIYFQESGLLYDEFSKLYSSLFKNPNKYIKILEYISHHHYGRSLSEISTDLKITSGGRLAKRLNELVASGFLGRFNIIGKKEKGHYFKVIDEFTNFYFYWLEHKINPKSNYDFKGEWNKIINSPNWHAWIGMSFENCCYKHIHEIKKALGLDHISCKVGIWISKGKCQIDLLFDRDDDIITLIEIKYSKDFFVLTKEIALNLKNKLETFCTETKTMKTVHIALVTVHGLKKNIWSEELISNVITIDQLF